MWPLKAHYTLWFGSLSGILPYVPVFAREHLHVSATSVGILYFVLPFIVSIGKPVACSAADHYRKHSQALLSSQLLTLIGYGTLVLIPFVVSILPSTTLLWYLFCALTLIANTSMGVGVSLTDYLVMDQVAQINQRGGNTNYGLYRIWGTVGFGVFGILSGIINEYSANLPYLIPGLFMFIAIELIDVVCVYRFYHIPNQSQTLPSQNGDLESFAKKDPQVDISLNTVPSAIQVAEQEPPKSMCSRITTRIRYTLKAIGATFRQVIKIYAHYPSLIQYTFIVFCFGILTAVHWSYFFWYIEMIRGKDPLLMGLCIFVNSFVGEIPVFMVSYRIINWVGPMFSLCISLAAFAVRYLCYGYLLQPEPGRYWDVLLIECLQGLTFSLFYTVMTHVAQYYADKCDQIDGGVKNLSDKEENSKLNDSSEGLETNTSQQDQMTPIDLTDNNGQEKVKQNENKQKPSATMQGLMSACYEGLGLGVGSLIGGYMTDQYGILTIWRAGAFLSIGLIVFNLVIELLKWTCARRQQNHRA